VRQAVARGRQYLAGLRHGLRTRASLTPEQVRDIRTRLLLGERQNALAKEYGVDRTNVSLISTGKTWRLREAGWDSGRG